LQAESIINSADAPDTYGPSTTVPGQLCTVSNQQWSVATAVYVKGWKVTSAGWQVTLRDPIWHVISRSGVVISITNCYIRVYFTLLYKNEVCFERGFSYSSPVAWNYLL